MHSNTQLLSVIIQQWHRDQHPDVHSSQKSISEFMILLQSSCISLDGTHTTHICMAMGVQYFNHPLLSWIIFVQHLVPFFANKALESLGSGGVIELKKEAKHKSGCGLSVLSNNNNNNNNDQTWSWMKPEYYA